MLKRIIGLIVKTGKTHTWQKYPCVLALVLIFGCVALAEYTVKAYGQLREAVGSFMVAIENVRMDYIEQREMREQRETQRRARPFVSVRRPAARITAAALSACMMFTLMPVTVFAAVTDSGTVIGVSDVCTHHTTHDGNCGFVLGKESAPCLHEHTEGCYTDHLICGMKENGGDIATDSDAPHTHTPDCYQLNCPHENGEHDDGCGYAEAVEGADCTYQCELCEVQDSGPIAPAPAVCDCTEKCTAADEANSIEEKINPDCTICSAENVDLAAACMGAEPKPLPYLMSREANVHNIKVTEFTGATVDECTYQILSETSPDTAENTAAIAAAGETVTVTMSTTKYNYATQFLALNLSDTKVVRNYDNPDQFSFVMPAQAVDLTLTFGETIQVFAQPYYFPEGNATPPSVDSSIDAVPYTSEKPLTGDDGVFNLSYPNPIPEDGGYLYKFSDGGDYGTVDTSDTHLVYTPNTNAAGKEVSICVKAFAQGGLSEEIEHKVNVGSAPVPDYNKDATLSALTYQVEGEEPVSIPLQENKTDYEIVLPFGTAVDKEVTLAGTPNDVTASITDTTAGFTTYGSLNPSESLAAATVTVTAQDPSVIKTYKVLVRVAGDNLPYRVINQDGSITYQDGDTIAVNTEEERTIKIDHGWGTGGAGAFSYKVEDMEIIATISGAYNGIYPNTIASVDLKASNVGSTTLMVRFYAEQTTQFADLTPIDTITLHLVCVDSVLTAAKVAAENATYDTTQEICGDENAAKTHVEGAVKKAVDNSDIAVEVTTGSYTPPQAGTSADRDGTNGSYTFTVTLSKNNQSQITNSITATITATAYTARPSGGGSTGGGGSSGDSGNIIVTPPAQDEPKVPTESEIKLPCKVDADGNATATVTDKAVSDAIQKAEDVARKNGNLDNGITLVLNVDTGNISANTISVNLPKVTQETIITKQIVNTVLVINNPDIQIGIDLAAVKQINTQAKADVNISATRMDNTKLTGAAKTAIGSRPAFDLKATYQNGAKSVASFGEGVISVALPYTPCRRERFPVVYMRSM